MTIRTLLTAVIATGLFAAAGATQAGPDPDSYFVSPGVLWLDPDNDLHADDDFGFRLGIGKVLNPKWDLELAYNETKHSAGVAGPTGDWKFGFTELDIKRVFARDKRINPYIATGIGMVTADQTGTAYNNSRDPGFKLGVGFMAGAASSARLQFLGEVGMRLDDLSDSSYGSLTGVYVLLGLRSYFGGAPAAAPVAAVAPTAAAAPAPAAAPPPPPPPADSDGDGVVDPADRCPNTPAGARVDASGCELDGDRDGVIDRLDRCPNTPAGDKVDAVGCGLTIALQVNFDNNSATIKPESYGELDNLVEFLKAVPSARGTLEGHTDSVGSDAYNRNLSQRRADSVKAYVTGKGIDAARIEARGFGEAQPVADNATAEGRAQNRRVQFTRTSLQQ